jgi:DNA-binding MarR family transcriptional regulator
MKASDPSSTFTKSPAGEPFGPPLIGALLRVPWEAVQRGMLERLHERGFDDLDAAHLAVFQYPGPQGARPSELAARLRISKQALNYLLGELERFGYIERRPDPDDLRSKRVALTPRGASAIGVIREAVADVETTWAEQLGAKRFAQLRGLLVELNEQA